MRERIAPFAAGTLAFLLPVAAVPGTITGYRFVITIVIAAAGAVLLPLAVLRRPDITVALGAAFVTWAGIAAIGARNTTMSFWGLYNWATGFMFVVALAGAWIIGRVAGEDGRRWVHLGLIAAVVINSVIALAQTAFSLSRWNLDLYAGRPSALMGNPVYLGILLGGGFWLAARLGADHLPQAVALTLLVAAAVQASGGRSTLLALVVSLAVVPLAWRPRLLLIAVAVVGLGVGSVAASRHHGSTGASRLVEAPADQGGFRARTEMWLASRHAVANAPVLGAGPGRFGAATQRYRTLRYTRDEGPGVRYADAHNILVEYGVTTGIPGLVFLLAWLALLVRRAGLRTPLGGFAAIVLLLHLVEPQSLHVTPLAFLALGSAGPPLDLLTDRLSKLVAALGTAAGVAAGAVAGAGFWHLNQANLDFARPHAVTATRLLPPWPFTVEQRARIEVFDSHRRRRPELLEVALRYRREAVRRDGEDPETWLNLADLEGQMGHGADEVSALRHMLRLDPWSTVALNELARQDLLGNDAAGALPLLRRSLLANPKQPTIAQIVDRLQAP